jgi:hypothetical protein
MQTQHAGVLLVNDAEGTLSIALGPSGLGDRTSAHLPSIDALVGPDDRLLGEQLRWLAIREQAAVVRALSDHLECLGPGQPDDSLRAQLVEELARLGCRIFEAAAALAGVTPPAPQSGVLPV